jgi:glycosyltransferase involved in cell wall biosynthesis
MQNFAINGRGIREDNTCVIPTGIDANRFKPNPNAKPYLEKEFSIPTNNKVAFYSGHMEERKGVKVIIEAAIELIDKRNQHDIYFLICGNRPGEEIPFQEMLANTKAKSKVVFGGYRNDLDQIMSGCDVGLLASTGWDSFPMSTLEMASCGLPLVVSSLQGLVETIEDQKTGYLFEPGNSVEMANKIQLIINNETLGKQFSKAGRERILNGYTVEHQKANLKNRLTTTLNA